MILPLTHMTARGSVGVLWILLGIIYLNPQKPIQQKSIYLPLNGLAVQVLQ